MNIVDHFENSDGGSDELLAAELRYEVLRTLNLALDDSGLTKKELADNLGVDKTEVNKVFRGNGNIDIDTFSKYASALGFEVKISLKKKGSSK